MPISSEYLKSKIDSVRAEIGRNVTFYTLTSDRDEGYVASGYYDPMSDTSFVYTWTTTTVLARIHWAGDERIQMSPGGKYYVGDCQLTIDPTYHSLAQRAMKDAGKVVVDGRDMQIKSINPMGAPTINRIRLICKGIGLQSDQEG